jgi:hypothetical protein
MATETNNSGEVNTPATPAADPVTFTPEQQVVVDRIIQDRLGREKNASRAAVDAANAAKAALEAQLADAKKNIRPDGDANADQIAEFKRVSEQSRQEVEASRKAAELKSQEAKAAQDRLAQYKKEVAITNEASKQGFIDPSIVVHLVSGHVQVGEDGKMTVVGDNGEQRFNAAYQPMSVEEYISEFAAQKKYLVRGDTKTGAGSTPGSSTPGQPQYKPEDLFGPKSIPGLANKIALSDKAKYNAIRAQAVAAGMLR